MQNQDQNACHLASASHQTSQGNCLQPTPTITLLADPQVIGVDYFFQDLARIDYAHPVEIPQRLSEKHFDILLVRSTTALTHAIAHSGVTFVGSCVTGTDHIDFTAFQEPIPHLFTAEGCNSLAVLAYIQNILIPLKLPKSSRVGILGVGRIGSRVLELFKTQGFEIFTSDPFRQGQPGFCHTPLEHLKNLDLITCHVPLTRSGPHPTYHRLDQHFFNRQSSQLIFINTSRGDIVSDETLLQLTTQQLILDVWPHEPHINPDLIQKALLATPHIAGATPCGLWNGTYQCYLALCQQFGWPALKTIPRKAQDNTHPDLWALSEKFKAKTHNVCDLFQTLRRDNR